jgi:hypothetical protein
VECPADNQQNQSAHMELTSDCFHASASYSKVPKVSSLLSCCHTCAPELSPLTTCNTGRRQQLVTSISNRSGEAKECRQEYARDLYSLMTITRNYTKSLYPSSELVTMHCYVIFKIVAVVSKISEGSYSFYDLCVRGGTMGFSYKPSRSC